MLQIIKISVYVIRIFELLSTDKIHSVKLKMYLEFLKCIIKETCLRYWGIILLERWAIRRYQQKTRDWISLKLANYDVKLLDLEFIIYVIDFQMELQLFYWWPSYS